MLTWKMNEYIPLWLLVQKQEKKAERSTFTVVAFVA